MKYIHKSMEEIYEDCYCWAAEIARSYQPDLLVFVAKSGYLFAKPLSDYFQCPMVDILVSRPASGTKDFLKGIIKIIPQKIIDGILGSKWMYLFHEKNDKRDMVLTERFNRAIVQPYENILIVDDSVDTGWTAKMVKEAVKNKKCDSVVKLASYCVISASEKRLKTDFVRYTDTIVLTGTSRKSKEYEVFLAEYGEWVRRSGMQSEGSVKDA